MFSPLLKPRLETKDIIKNRNYKAGRPCYEKLPKNKKLHYKDEEKRI